MNDYWHQIQKEVDEWTLKMQKAPGLGGKLSKKLQSKINGVIPAKVHYAISTAIKQMVRAMIFGSVKTTRKNHKSLSLPAQDKKVRNRIEFYSGSAAAEGAATGSGGILLSFADFPIWLSLKMKMLHEIANIYGFDVNDYKERIFLLYIFQITFSSQIQKNQTINILTDWEEQMNKLPADIHAFDWKTFQIEYRDYLDWYKLFQMLPGVGAIVGAYVNHRLTKRLGRNAIQAYHMRLLQTLAMSGNRSEEKQSIP